MTQVTLTCVDCANDPERAGVATVAISYSMAARWWMAYWVWIHRRCSRKVT